MAIKRKKNQIMNIKKKSDSYRKWCAFLWNVKRLLFSNNILQLKVSLTSNLSIQLIAMNVSRPSKPKWQLD